MKTEISDFPGTQEKDFGENRRISQKGQGSVSVKSSLASSIVCMLILASCCV